LWAWLCAVWNDWQSRVILVQAATVISWHRKGFRLFWAWKVRQGKPGRPAVPKEVRALIRTMSRQNPLWGAPRIHGELLKLGIDIGETRVSKYLVCGPAMAATAASKAAAARKVNGSRAWSNDAASAAGLGAFAETDVLAVAGEYVRENLLVIADRLPRRVREVVGIVREAKSADSVSYLDMGQLLGPRHGKAAKAHRVEELKNSGVSAGAESQGADGGYGEHRGLAQNAESKGNVAQGRFDPQRAARGAAFLLGCIEAPELKPSAAVRLFFAHP